MRRIARSLLPIAMALPFTFLFAAGAQAQMDCGQCTSSSSCDETCTICRGPDTIDQGCSNYDYSTCGDAGGFVNGCMQSGCTPNYQVIGDELRGTYGEGVGTNTCFHHRVDWVTRHDYNQCNTNSA